MPVNRAPLKYVELGEKMRILGLDMGQKTIGVAISDPLGFTAQGIKTIYRKNKEQDIIELKRLCTEYSVEKIVVGLPKNMDNSIGFAGEKILGFTEILKEEICLEVELWDERLTTVAAHRAMLEGDLSRAKRKKIVDKIAAIFILQGYLDRISNLK